eukprot:GFUD01002068.1.p1 GENE.GFUD01002068.1~~GFUD01002068.1.p1  ORF type:complete len:370 (+),score=99.20 GFUD01002068.1:760-1869(+)
MVLDLTNGYCQKKYITNCEGRELLYRDVEKEVEDKLAEKIRKIEEEAEQFLTMAFQNDIKIGTKKNAKFQRIDLTKSKGGASDANNPGRPLVLLKNVVGRKPSPPPVSTTIVKKTVSPPPVSPRFSTQVVAKQSPDPLADLTCDQSEEGYIVPDPEQCDRFAECSPHGEKFYKLCPDGLVLSLAKGLCDYPVKVDCTDRPKLQSSLGTGHCIRENGNFPLPADVSCSKYVDCRGGEGHVQSCGSGAVFDQVLGCVHPDETKRPGCSAVDQYNFQCPTFGLNQRFGDHDRLPHPTDCKLFYACLRNGLPRQLGCKKPSVFNPETGLCDDQENVPGCEGYYVKEEVVQEDRDKIAHEIRKQLIKEFGLDRL